MNLYTIFPICLLLMACSTRDVSRQAPFLSAVREPVSLTREAYLKPRKPAYIQGGSSFFRKSEYELTSRKPVGSHQVLEPGAMVKIASVQEEVFIDGLSYIAYGTTALSNGLEVDFAYCWGFINLLERAPWEADHVPDRRRWPLSE